MLLNFKYILSNFSADLISAFRETASAAAATKNYLYSLLAFLLLSLISDEETDRPAADAAEF
jgi:hypothetical protein